MSASFYFTENEYEIVDLLWKQGQALSRSEIIKLLPDKSWSDSSIHIILNKLLDKGAIEVGGFVKTGRNFGRTYCASITRDEYRLMQIKRTSGASEGERINVPAIFSALIQQEEIDSDTIAELEMILARKKSGDSGEYGESGR